MKSKVIYGKERRNWSLEIYFYWQVKRYILSAQICFFLYRRHSWAYSCPLTVFINKQMIMSRFHFIQKRLFHYAINDLICCSSYLSNIAPAISERMCQNLLCEWCSMVLIENLWKIMVIKVVNVRKRNKTFSKQTRRMTILPDARMITSSLWFFSFFLDGLYTIKPGHRQVQTFCKFSDHGGAWTLVLTSASDNGWARDNVKSRNIHNPSLSSDFSLLGMADNITKMKHFQVRTYQHVNQLTTHKSSKRSIFRYKAKKCFNLVVIKQGCWILKVLSS